MDVAIETRELCKHYGAKAAVDAVTKTLSKELGPRNIRVNAINLGVIETEGVNAGGLMESDLVKQIAAQTPLGRIGQPSDVAPAAVFLASDDAAYVTGSFVTVDGGVLFQQRSPEIETFPVASFPAVA